MNFLFGVPGKLKTLLDRLTSTRAGLLDNLDAAISSTAPASTALSSATWTGTRAAKLDNIGIKLIQQGVIVVNCGNGRYDGSNTATITSVSTSKAFVMLLGVSLDADDNNQPSGARVALTNATTVTAYVHRAVDGTARDFNVGYVVIEFN